MNVLTLSPEPPYPLEGGGAFRIASLLHYFARFAEVDLILISDSGAPALLPPGLVRASMSSRFHATAGARSPVTFAMPAAPFGECPR